MTPRQNASDRAEHQPATGPGPRWFRLSASPYNRKRFLLALMFCTDTAAEIIEVGQPFTIPAGGARVFVSPCHQDGTLIEGAPYLVLGNAPGALHEILASAFTARP